LAEIDLGELVELSGDLLGGQCVVAGDRQVVGGSQRALDLALDLRHSGHIARLARGALGLGGGGAGGALTASAAPVSITS